MISMMHFRGQAKVKTKCKAFGLFKSSVTLIKVYNNFGCTCLMYEVLDLYLKG